MASYVKCQKEEVEALAFDDKHTNHTSQAVRTFGIVVGERSGDTLGAGLIAAIRQYLPNARFVGIGGPKMEQLGFESWFPLERLAVMGIVDVLRRLPELLGIRKELVKRFIIEQPEAFIGIDAPDFNLGLALRLKQARIKTVHYVSPSVWAWRSGRIKTIKQAVDRMLTLFPFEVDIYRQAGVDAQFVGHPSADNISLEDQTDWGREALKLSANATYIGVLPGSRTGEIRYLAPEFIRTMIYLKETLPDVSFLVPMVSEKKAAYFREKLEEIPGALNLPLQILVGKANEVMAASNILLIASGTATLEGLLYKKPMVVAYKWHPLTHLLIAPFVKTPFIALPNILANKMIVPEYIQGDVQAGTLLKAITAELNQNRTMDLVRDFTKIHVSLREHADENAARAILSLVGMTKPSEIDQFSSEVGS